MVKKKKDAKQVQNNEALLVREYFVKKDIENLGLAVAELDGEYGENKNREVDQIIYIIEGKIMVEMGGEKFELDQDDSILIRKGDWYFVNGKAKFMVVTSPAWYFEQYEMRERTR